MPIHRDLPDAELHEPKGVASAAAGTVYLADGAGSGDWGTPPFKFTQDMVFQDISTAGSTYTVAAFAGTIKKIYIVLFGAVATANDVVTFYINGVPITNGAVTVDYTTSGAGVIYSAVPTAANTIAKGDLITATSSGGSSSSQRAVAVLEIEG